VPVMYYLSYRLRVVAMGAFRSSETTETATA